MQLFMLADNTYSDWEKEKKNYVQYIHMYVHSMDPCVKRTKGSGTSHIYTNIHSFYRV